MVPVGALSSPAYNLSAWRGFDKDLINLWRGRIITKSLVRLKGPNRGFQQTIYSELSITPTI